MSKELFFTLKKIGQTDIRANAEEDLGLDWDIHSDSTTLGEVLYSDAGLVKIDELMATLVELQDKGANYVACDWHDDHQELEVYGVEFRVATDEERDAHIAKLEKYTKEKTELEISRLEARIKNLKGE